MSLLDCFRKKEESPEISDAESEKLRVLRAEISREYDDFFDKTAAEEYVTRAEHYVTSGKSLGLEDYFYQSIVAKLRK